MRFVLESLDRFNLNKGDIAIGIIGRLTDIKNHLMFFDVIEDVINQTSKQIRAFIIGGGELEEDLKKRATQIERNYGESVFTFTSWIKDVDIPLARLDVVCLTSHNEGTPVSLIEAQAANVVVMSTNVGGVKDVVNVNNTGFVLDDFSVKKYAQKLLELIENEEKRKKMSQNGWDYVKNKFHYTRLCSEVEKLYLELLNINKDES